MEHKRWSQAHKMAIRALEKWRDDIKNISPYVQTLADNGNLNAIGVLQKIRDITEAIDVLGEELAKGQ